MSEYIDRDIAVKAIMAAKWEIGSDGAVAMEIVAGSPTADVEPVKHGRWVKSRKHKWKLDRSGKIDLWAWASDFHNGPECEICFATPCVHCKPDWEKTICSVLHFECSECGEVSKYGIERYCGGCGAKMDREAVGE